MNNVSETMLCIQYNGHTNTGEGKVGLACSYLRRTDETAHGRRDPWWQKKKEKWKRERVAFQYRYVST